MVASAFGLAHTHAQDSVTFENTDVVESSTYDETNDVWVGGNALADYLAVATPTSSRKTPGIPEVTSTAGVYYRDKTISAVGIDFSANWDGKNSSVAQLLKFDVTNGPVCGDGDTCSTLPAIVDIHPVVTQAGFSTSQLNDLVVTPSGDTYITDSWNGALYYVSSNNEASLFLATPPEWAPVQSSFGKLKLSANGIEHFTDDQDQEQEYLLVVLSLQKDSLYRVSIPSSGDPVVEKVTVSGDPTWAENAGNDGLRFLPLELYGNPWEQVFQVTHQDACDCTVDPSDLQTLNFYAQPGSIVTDFVSTNNCNSFSTIALVYAGDVTGFSHEFRLAVDGDLTNTPDDLPTATCTMSETTGDIECTFSNNCANSFAARRPKKFLGASGLDQTVRMFHSSDNFVTADLVGVDDRSPTGVRTTLGIKDGKIFVNDLGSFTEAASTTTKPFEYQSDWELVDPSKGDKGCCRFNEDDRWAEPGKEIAVRATSLPQCQEACSADARCIAIEYVPKKFKCEIHIAKPSFASPAQECLCLLKPGSSTVSSATMTYLSEAILGALIYAVLAF